MRVELAGMALRDRTKALRRKEDDHQKPSRQRARNHTRTTANSKPPRNRNLRHVQSSGSAELLHFSKLTIPLTVFRSWVRKRKYLDLLRRHEVLVTVHMQCRCLTWADGSNFQKDCSVQSPVSGTHSHSEDRYRAIPGVCDFKNMIPFRVDPKHAPLDSSPRLNDLFLF